MFVKSQLYDKKLYKRMLEDFFVKCLIKELVISMGQIEIDNKINKFFQKWGCLIVGLIILDGIRLKKVVEVGIYLLEKIWR